MDEIKPARIEKKKTKLTDEQKTEIRLEMTKCTTEEEAREHRKLLADYYGVTVQQIAGVSAYKVSEDGTLSLTPQFGTSRAMSRPVEGQTRAKDRGTSPAPSVPEIITSQIESTYDNPTKRAWRMKVKETIGAEFTAEQLHKARVVCLPGRALQEVADIYLQLGIRPQNIICVERDAQVAAAMRVAAHAKELPVTIFEGTIEEFFRSPHQPVTIASFDFLGPLHASFLEGLHDLKTAERFMMITNFLQRREQKLQQTTLGIHTSIDRSLRDFRHSTHGSKFGDSVPQFETKDRFEENVHELLTGPNHLELADARDEGMIGTLRTYLTPDTYLRPLDALYAEVGADTPPFPEGHDIDFLYKLTTEAHAIINAEFGRHPGLLDKVSRAHRKNPKAALVNLFDTKESDFLERLGATLGLCMVRRVLCDVQRFKYTSETSGSPYQTDIFVELNLESVLKKHQEDAFTFIRDFVRLLGVFGKERVSVRLEKFGKLLPGGYSGGAVALGLVLRADGVTRKRISLHALERFIEYVKGFEKDFEASVAHDTFYRPRLTIKPPSN